MKALPLILAALLGGLVAAGAVTLFAPKSPASAAAPANDAQELAGLREELRALASRIDAQAKAPALEAASAPRLPVGEIEAAVERALAQHASAPGAGETAAARSSGAKPSSAASGPGDLAAALASVGDPNASYEERLRRWREYAKAGMLDELVAEYEKLAGENPNDPKAQTALGNAYLQKIFNGAAGPEAGIWGTKADKAFDKAIALDDHNWDARYMKAVSLSNWPAFLGKQPEAIHNFEVLVEQQSQGAVKPEYAQTYLILGNLYQQTGKLDKALAIWQQGQSMFPDVQQFGKQIQLAQQQH